MFNRKLFGLICLLSAFVQIGRSQDQAGLLAHRSTVQLRFEIDGSLIERSYGSLSLAPVHPLESFLSRAKFKNELAISQDQVKAIDQLLEFCKSEKKNLVKGAATSDLRYPSEKYINSFQNLKEEFSTRLDGILLPHQITRANELRYRSLIRQKGAYQFLIEFAKAKGLDLAKPVNDKVKLHCRDFRMSLGKKLKTLESDFKDAIVAALNDSQTEKLEKMLKGSGWFSDFLIHEIENVGDKSLTLGEIPEDMAEEEFDFLERLRESVVMTWVPEDCSWEVTKIKRPRLNTARGLIDALLHIDGLSDDFGLTSEQVESLRRCYEADSVKKSEMNSEYSDVMKNGGDIEKVREKLRNSYRERETELVVAISDEILLPHQKHEIISQIEKRIAIRKGPIALLFSGALDGELALSETQKKRLKKTITEQMKKLGTELNQLEESFIDELLELVDPDIGKELKTALGESPKYSTPSIYVLRNNIAKIPHGM